MKLGLTEDELGNRSAAEQTLRRALAIWRRAPDGIDPQFAPVLLDLGRWLAQRQRCDEAIPILRRAVQIHRAIQQSASSPTAELQRLLAGCS